MDVQNIPRPHSVPVAGLILGGGQSRRFGEDKARHPVGGIPMIRQVYRALRAVADPVVVSVGAGQASYADVLPPHVRYVRDRHPQAGPLAGLQAGFRVIRTAWVIVVACDMPHVTPDGFGALLQAQGPGLDAVVARTGNGRTHPLFASYRRAPVRKAVEACLDAETYALSALLDRLTVRDVPVPSDLVRNVNRLSDLDS